jgi:hypothetical protein
MSNAARLIRIKVIELKRCEMMFSENVKSILKGWVNKALGLLVRLKALAPYACIELVLPGGSLVALLLWLYRRKKNGVGFGSLGTRLLSVLRLADALRSIGPAPSARMPSPILSTRDSIYRAGSIRLNGRSLRRAPGQDKFSSFHAHLK